MTLNAGLEMRKSASLKGRVETVAYDKGQTMQWVDKNYPGLCASSDWRKAWSDAPLYNPDGTQTDPGARDDVISDSMIATAVQALIDQQAKDTTAEQDAADQRIAELEAKVAELQKVVEQATATAATEPAAEADAAPAE